MTALEIMQLILLGVLLVFLGVSIHFLRKSQQLRKKAEVSHAKAEQLNAELAAHLAAKQHVEIMREYREDTRRAIEGMEGKGT